MGTFKLEKIVLVLILVSISAVSCVQEVFVFSTSNKNWHFYDWTKLTSIVECGYHDDDLLQYAHKNNVVVSYAVGFPTSMLKNGTAIEEWTEKQIDYITLHHLDGINVDFEDQINATDSVTRNAFTRLIVDLSTRLRKTLPNAQVTIDLAWSPDCIDNRCYDYGGLIDTVDFAFIMSYDERSQIFGPCVAWANSPFNMTMLGLKQFLALDAPVHKLVLGVPWYGYDYQCIKYNSTSQLCDIKPVPYVGVACSDAAGTQVGYSGIMQMLKSSSTGRLWDREARSPYFTYTNKAGDTHQVWYDDPYSLTSKYALADELSFHGIGFWEADSLNYDNTPEMRKYVKEMWDALPPHGEHRAITHHVTNTVQ